MKISLPLIFLCFLLFEPASGFAQEPQPQPGRPATQPFEKERQAIELELAAMAQDSAVIDAKLNSKNPSTATVSTAPQTGRLRELLEQFDPARIIQEFFKSSDDDRRWELCLKSSKLYQVLVEALINTSDPCQPLAGKAPCTSSISAEASAAAQLLFVARRSLEQQLRYQELPMPGGTTAEVQPRKHWALLREAVENDDRSNREKIRARLAATGQSGPTFAAKILFDASATSPTAATGVAAGMELLDGTGDLWKLESIAGINPAFIKAARCEQKAMDDFRASKSQASLAESCRCGQAADGVAIPAFLPQGPTKPGAENPNGVFLAETTRPKIPSWWIKCQCPDDHPNAGIVVDGERWHAPVLTCPNPALRQLEMPK